MKNIGIDIGKRKCAVCIMDEDGAVLEELAYNNTFKDAVTVAQNAKEKYGKCQAACESTGNMWIKTFEAFESKNIPIKLANTFKMKIISEMDVKTDPIDARKIANALRASMIPECYVAPPELRDVREIMRYRIRIVQNRTGVTNQLRSLLDKYDIQVGATQIYSAKAIKILSKAKLGHPYNDCILQDSIGRIADLTQRIKKIEKEIDRATDQNDEAKILMSMTGIDAFSAMLIMAEIGYISRFKTP